MVGRIDPSRAQEEKWTQDRVEYPITGGDKERRDGEDDGGGGLAAGGGTEIGLGPHRRRPSRRRTSSNAS